MKVVLLVILLALLSTVALAQNLGSLYELSQESRDIVMKLPAAQGLNSGKFEISPLEATLAQQVSNIDQNVDGYIRATDPSNPYNLPLFGCDEGLTPSRNKVKALTDKPDYQSFQTVSTSDQDMFERQAMARLEMNNDAYQAFIEKIKKYGNFRANDIATIADLKKLYLSKKTKVNFDELDPVDQERLLAPFVKEYLGVEPDKGIITQSIIFESTAGGVGDFEKLTKKSKDELTLEQKVAIVSRMGARAMVMAGDDEAKKKVREGMGIAGDVAQVHDSLKYKKGKEAVTSIGLAQSKWLTTLGLEDAYVVGFRAAMGDEAATVAFDPKEKKFVAIGGPPSGGKVTDVFDSNGQLIKKVDSRLLKIFNDVGRGGDNSAFLNHKYAVQKIGFSDEDTSGHVFAGTTMQGEALYGAAITKKMSTKYYRLETGGGFGRSPMDEEKGIIRSRGQIYGRISQEAHTAEFNLDGSKIQTFVRNENEFLNTDLTSSATSAKQIRGIVQPGIRGSTTFNNGATKFKAEAVYDVYPSWDKTDKKVTNREIASVKTGVKHRLTDNLGAVIDSTIMVRNYSTVIANDVGITDDSGTMRMTVGTETSLRRRSDTPASIVDDERTKVRARFEKAFVKKNLTISVDFVRQGDDRQIYLQGQLKF